MLGVKSWKKTLSSVMHGYFTCTRSIYLSTCTDTRICPTTSENLGSILGLEPIVFCGTKGVNTAVIPAASWLWQRGERETPMQETTLSTGKLPWLQWIGHWTWWKQETDLCWKLIRSRFQKRSVLLLFVARAAREVYSRCTVVLFFCVLSYC